METRDSVQQVYRFPNLKHIYISRKEEYKLWLLQNYSKDYHKSMMSALDKLFKVLDSFSPINILDIIKRKKLDEQYSIKGIRNFLKFCEECNYLDEATTNEYKNKVKYKEKSRCDIYVPNKGDVNNTLNIIREKSYSEYLLLRILLETGCRVTELIEFINTFKPYETTIQDKVAAYPLSYLRGNKQSYFLFMTEKLHQDITENIQEIKKTNIETLKTYIKRHKLVPMKYFRKYTFTLMIDVGIEFEIANYIQGRISKNVGMNHYLAKKQLAIKQYKRLSFD